MPAASDVQALLSSQVPTPAINAAIDAAGLLFNEVCFAGYSEDRRESLTLYLAAHILSITPAAPVVESKSIDGVSYKYRSVALGKGLNGTAFGQFALTLDVSDCLRGSTGRLKVRLL